MTDKTQPQPEPSVNEKIARAFADQFVPPLRIVRTDRVNNIPMRDAWNISFWNGQKGIGITAVVYGGQIHAFLECAGTGDVAEHAGLAFAKALGLLPEKPNGKA